MGHGPILISGQKETPGKCSKPVIQDIMRHSFQGFNNSQPTKTAPNIWLWLSKPMGSHFGVAAPPILEPILVGIGMFTGGTIWILTHGHFEGTHWQMEPMHIHQIKIEASFRAGVDPNSIGRFTQTKGHGISPSTAAIC